MPETARNGFDGLIWIDKGKNLPDPGKENQLFPWNIL
jgi:hypothetical protein